MTIVFSSNADCIHTFAQRSQDEGRTPNGNVFFIGDKLYSYGYHYLMAEFIDDYVMINDSGYSSSTSRHISITQSATSHYQQYFKTETDIDLVHDAIIGYKNKLARANKPELYILPAQALWKKLNHFLTITKAKKYKSNKKYKEMKVIIDALNDSPEEFKQKIAAAAKKAAAAQKRKDAKQLKDQLVKFNNHEINWFRIGNEDYLRLSKDGEFVETTQGVKVSVESAKTLYDMIVRGIEIRGKRIEQYKITSINGTLKIGCHSINIDSMHKIGKLL